MLALSVVVPLFNEEDSVGLLVSKLMDALAGTGIDFEIILVDDGSSDNTFPIAKTLAQQETRLKVIKFRKNFGQTPAMAAGIDNASGEIIVTMDGDLQNDPEDIPMMVGKIKAGADIVVGWRHQRQDAFLSRKLPSIIANKLIGRVTGVPVKDNGCSLKAYRSVVIKRIPLYSEMHRFIPAMSSIAGARIEEVKVRHHARQFGESKYGLSRIYKVLFDLLAIKTVTRFAARPMQCFGMLAIPFALLMIALTAYAFWNVIMSDSEFYVVVSGLAVACGATAGFLVTCGTLAELVFKFGADQPSFYWRLTARSSLLSDQRRQH